MSAHPHNKTVIDGVLQHVSASQITTFGSCARRWFAEKVLGIKDEQTFQQSEGETIHAELEAYYSGGPRPTYASTLRLLEDPKLPPPDPEFVFSEHPRDYKLGLEAAGVKVLGRMDLVDASPGTWANLIRIFDWKSTKSFRWNKTPDELARNVQLNIYGKWMFAFHDIGPALVSAHGYILTSGTGAKLVTTDPLPRSHFDDTFLHIEETVARMKKTAALTDFRDVEPTFSRNTCKAYNKICPMAGHCGEEAFKAAGVWFPDSTPVPTTEGSTPTMSLSEMAATRKTELVGSTSAVVRAEGINPPDAAYYPPKAETTATPAPAEEAPTQAPADPPPTLSLFIDCFPSKIPGEGFQYLRLEDEIARRAEPIAKKLKVTDVREAPYGVGTSALMATFQIDRLYGNVIANSVGLSAQAIEILTAQAAVVIRGIR